MMTMGAIFGVFFLPFLFFLCSLYHALTTKVFCFLLSSLLCTLQIVSLPTYLLEAKIIHLPAHTSNHTCLSLSGAFISLFLKIVLVGKLLWQAHLLHYSAGQDH
jgi:hypothetical protein